MKPDLPRNSPHCVAREDFVTFYTEVHNIFSFPIYTTAFQIFQTYFFWNSFNNFLPISVIP